MHDGLGRARVCGDSLQPMGLDYLLVFFYFNVMNHDGAGRIVDHFLHTNPAHTVLFLSLVDYSDQYCGPYRNYRSIARPRSYLPLS